MIFIFKFKLGEIENETNLKQKKKPLSSKTGQRRVLMGLKGNRSRKRHLKSRFCDTLEGFPTVKTGKKNSKTSFAAEILLGPGLRHLNLIKQLLPMVSAKKNKAMVGIQPISLPKTKKQGLMQRCD